MAIAPVTAVESARPPHSIAVGVNDAAHHLSGNTEEHFGHTIVDPYRWLENDVRGDKDVARWVDEQNALTQSYLVKAECRKIMKIGGQTEGTGCHPAYL